MHISVGRRVLQYVCRGDDLSAQICCSAMNADEAKQQINQMVEFIRQEVWHWG